MKASVSPRTLIVAFSALIAASTLACAQDLVVQKDKQRREGLITGVADGKIKIKVGPVETTIPLDQAASVTKAAPKSYEDGLVVWQKGDAAQAFAIFQPLVQSFRGLPTPWAERSSALLGEIYLAQDKVADAEAAFTAFQAAYPNATSVSDVGLARLALEKKDYATAEAKLQPIVQEAQQVVLAPAGKSAIYGQAYFLMGQVNEAQDKLPEALNDYLSAVTLCYEDQAVVNKAQQKADALIKDKQVIVP